MLGAGGIGTVVGTLLAAGGNDVTMVTERQHEADHLTRHGTRVTGAVELAARPRSTAGPIGMERDDILIVAVKAHQTAAALERVHSSPGTALTLQNGIEKELRLTKRFGPQPVLPCLVQVTASLKSPGVSTCGAIEPSAISPPLPAAADAAKEVAEAFSLSGMPMTVVDNALDIEWAKAAQWLPSSLLTAATSLPLDQVLTTHGLASAYVAVTRECAAVAAAHGHELAAFGRLYAASIAQGPLQDAVTQLSRLGESMGNGPLADYRTAMELDLAHHRPLELDPTAGAMVRAARATGTQVPVLAALIAVVEGRAAGIGVATAKATSAAADHGVQR